MGVGGMASCGRRVESEGGDGGAVERVPYKWEIYGRPAWIVAVTPHRDRLFSAGLCGEAFLDILGGRHTGASHGGR